MNPPANVSATPSRLTASTETTESTLVRSMSESFSTNWAASIVTGVSSSVKNKSSNTMVPTTFDERSNACTSRRLDAPEAGGSVYMKSRPEPRMSGTVLLDVTSGFKPDTEPGSGCATGALFTPLMMKSTWPIAVAPWRSRNA